ncbi:hypothetical protein [Chengkuizengella marina]|uniref:Uncharacterized protein n=1 Tax=Chengkuizengella marina TaxID=2507566 RepID=A0A6N9PYT3_9BACL|nr:hypothetical protein [Chengkuizengella marina]NBI27583.1 hypothetical protein [Chengkuizengella marina]
MKKILSCLLVISLLIGQGAVSYASINLDEFDKDILVKDVTKLKGKEIKRLQDLGFTLQDINEMTIEEYTLQEGLYGEVIGTQKKWFEVDAKNNKVKEVSEKNAKDNIKKWKEEKELQNIDFSTLNDLISDSEQTSWMSVTTYVTKYVDSNGDATGQYRFKHDFEWLTTPYFALRDVVGISYSDAFTYNQNSEFFKYTYDRYSVFGSYKDTKHVTSNSATKKSSEGIAFEYDLLANDSIYQARNNRGYMYFNATLANSNFTTGNVFGHYAHTEVGIGSLGISLATGQMNISGATKVSNMDDTGISFSTQ